MFSILHDTWDSMKVLHKSNRAAYDRIAAERPGLIPPELRKGYVAPKWWQFWLGR